MAFFQQETVQRFGFFVIVVLLSFGIPILAFVYTSDIWIRLFVAVLSLTVLVLGFRLASDNSISDNRVRLAALTFANSILLGQLQFRDKVLSKLQSFGIGDFNVGWPGAQIDIVSISIIIATVAVTFVVLRSLAVRPAMGKPQSPIEDVLPRITNFDRLAIFKQTLKLNLDQLDVATRWNDANYVPLEAEVHIIEGKASRRRVVDLLDALRRDQRTRIFVVLGDPGTGKSVAMRKLARDLIAESPRSARIPIYVNLKEWRRDKTWTPDDPPTAEEFYKFLYYSILESLDFNSRSFLHENDNYRHLFEAGYFFFILDSFDEIPAVLDHDENSWLIDALSGAITKCVLGGHNSRGVLASRLFRKPKIITEYRSIFEIRPFSDDRIVRAIRAAATDSDRLIKIVLTERPDLGAIGRNPFLLQLIINHFNVELKPPVSQAQMFETYFRSNIQFAKEQYGFSGVADDEIYQICEDIADCMFKLSNVGLELSDVELKNEIKDKNLSKVLRFLTQARIGRIGPASGAFSFVHRRFNEYFLVRRMAGAREQVPYDAIQTDSRWRDAVVLYAEVASKDEATKMAKHAWQYAQRLEAVSLGGAREEFIVARHALRFMIEGFRNRADIVEPFQGSLIRIIGNKLDEDGGDLIEVKTVTEAIGLLQAEKSGPLIQRVVSNFPGWISESAAASARYLPVIDQELQIVLYNNVIDRPLFEDIRESRRQQEIFEISSAFGPLATWLRWYRINVYKNWLCLIAVVLLGCVLPYQTILRALAAGVFVSAFQRLLAFFMPGVRTTNRGRERRRVWDEGLQTIFRSMSGGNITSMASNVLGFVLFYLIVLAFTEAVRLVMPSVWPGGDGVARTDVYIIVPLCLFGVIPMVAEPWIEAGRSVGGGLIRRVIAGSLVLGAMWVSMILFLVVMPKEWIDRHKEAIAQTMLIGVSIGAVLGALFLTYVFLADYKRFRQATTTFAPERSKIAQQLKFIRTGFFRERYLEWVDRMSVDQLSPLRSRTNSWPDGKRPRLNSELLDARLAQIDARWLDLD